MESGHLNKSTGRLRGHVSAASAVSRVVMFAGTARVLDGRVSPDPHGHAGRTGTGSARPLDRGAPGGPRHAAHPGVPRRRHPKTPPPRPPATCRPQRLATRPPPSAEFRSAPAPGVSLPVAERRYHPVLVATVTLLRQGGRPKAPPSGRHCVWGRRPTPSTRRRGGCRRPRKLPRAHARCYESLLIHSHKEPSWTC